MDMEMTLNQKIEWVKDLISGQYSLWNRNDFYIPTNTIPKEIGESFWEILEKFERDGLIKKAYLGFAGMFDEQHKPEVFETIGEDGTVPRSSYKDGNGKEHKVKLQPTYYIKIDVEKLCSPHSVTTKHSSKEEIEFDSLSGVISFGKIVYAFHKKGSPTRRDFFRVLWEKRKIIKAGMIKRKGELTPPETVAANLGFVDSAQIFRRNPAAKEKLDSLIKNLEINLQRKKLPIRIYKQGGIQIVIDIK